MLKESACNYLESVKDMVMSLSLTAYNFVTISHCNIYLLYLISSCKVGFHQNCFSSSSVRCFQFSIRGFSAERNGSPKLIIFHCVIQARTRDGNLLLNFKRKAFSRRRKLKSHNGWAICLIRRFSF